MLAKLKDITMIIMARAQWFPLITDLKARKKVNLKFPIPYYPDYLDGVHYLS